MKPLLFAALCLSAGCASGQYVLGPDSQPQDGVPKGAVSKHVLAPGKYYPGTPHNYSIYVPAQYDASKPTAFMIFLDGSGSLGNQQRVPVVFDNLIAKHDLPPMIGIFVDPGVLPASRVTNGVQQTTCSAFYLAEPHSRFLFLKFLVVPLHGVVRRVVRRLLRICRRAVRDRVGDLSAARQQR